jgi:hypothetical protein
LHPARHRPAADADRGLCRNASVRNRCGVG